MAKGLVSHGERGSFVFAFLSSLFSNSYRFPFSRCSFLLRKIFLYNSLTSTKVHHNYATILRH